MSDWLKVGEWIINIGEVLAVRYEEGPEGPRAEVFTASGMDRLNSSKGGFSAVGDEAVALWTHFCGLAVDPLLPVEAKPKPKPRRKKVEVTTEG